MIPGKKYAPEDFLRIAWRRRWLLLLPLLVSAIGTFVYSLSLPNRYRSQATVLIIPQQVPEKFIRATVEEQVNQRLDLMRQHILSRPRLERIVEEFDLYREERKVLLMDQVIERMRDDIGVSVQKVGRNQDPNHFVVSYQSESAETAKVVAERLASLFVRENIEGRSVQSDATTQFLQSQVDDSLRQLQEHEGRLESFKREHAGRLPTELQLNIELMQNARQEIQALADGINTDRERRLAIDRTIADETNISPLVQSANGRGAVEGTPASQPAAQQLALARNTLEGLLLRFKEDHPDVRIVRSRIRDLEKRAEAEALQQPLSEVPGVVVAALTPAEVARQRRLSQLRGEQQRLDREIASKESKIRRVQASLQAQERSIQGAPGLQAQMADMMRNYDTLKGTYDNLFRKLQDAKLASSLEQRQVSQQFRIIDPARRPERPGSPDRLKINLIGALFGLAFGLAIAGLLEYRDTALRTEDDVLVALALPVLAIVPTMRTVVDDRQRRKRRLLLLGSSTAAMVLSLLAVVWKLRLFEQWGR